MTLALPSPKSALKSLLGLAWQGADRLFLPWLPGPQTQIPTLLMVRLDRIGDMVLWLPAARRLAAHFKTQGYRVVVLAAAECTVLLREIAEIDEIIGINRSALLLNPFYRLRTLRRVRHLGATFAVNPTFSRVAALGDALIRASAAARRIGWVGDGAASSLFERRLGDSAYTELLSDPTGTQGELARNEALPALLGVHAAPWPCVPLPRDAVQGLPHRFYVLAPGASQELRRWPVERFAALARLIHTGTGWTGIICGGRDDGTRARRLQAAAPDVPLIDMTGATALPGLVDLIAQARLVVSCDSAAIHIAAAMRTPSVCIAGGGGYGRFVPYPGIHLAPVTPPLVAVQPRACFGCAWKCPYRPTGSRPAPCIEDVSVELAWTEVQRVLHDQTAGPAVDDSGKG